MPQRPACLCADKPGSRCDAVHCDRVRLGEPYTLDQCRACWNFFHRPEYHRGWGGDGKSLASIDLGFIPDTLLVVVEGTIYEGSYHLTARRTSPSRGWLFGSDPSTMALFYLDGDWRFLMRCDTEIDYNSAFAGRCRRWTRGPLRIELDAVCPCCGRRSCGDRRYTATVTAAS